MQKSSQIKLYQSQNMEKKISHVIYQLLLVICLSTGCWLVLWPYFTGELSQKVILLVSAGSAVFLYIAERISRKRKPVVIGMLLIFLLLLILGWGREAMVFAGISGLVNVGMVTSLLNQKIVPAIAVTAWPLTMELCMAVNPDIYALTLLVLAWCGCFVLKTLPSKEVPIAGERTNFGGLFLLSVLGVSVIIANVFSDRGIRNTQTAENMKNAIMKLQEQLNRNQLQENQMQKNMASAAGSVQNKIEVIHAVLPWYLLFGILFLVILFGMIALWRRYRLKSRLRRFDTVFDRETAFDMYRYLTEICAVAQIDLNIGQDAALRKMQNFRSEGFEQFLKRMIRLRFANNTILSEEEHLQMAAYIRGIAKELYEQQKKSRQLFYKYIRIRFL